MSTDGHENITSTRLIAAYTQPLHKGAISPANNKTREMTERIGASCRSFTRAILAT